MKKILSDFFFENLFLWFLILMILPFVILFAFNHPSGDDYGAELTKISGFLTSQIKSYNSWSGKILSNALLCYSPVYFKSIFGYKAVTLLIMLVFCFVLFLFVTEFTSKNIDVKKRLIITLSVLFLFFYAMPSVAQSFYWITGSVVYMFSLIFIMLFYILCNRLDNPGSKFRTGKIIICSLLLIATAWSSEIAMELMLLSVSLTTAVVIYKERKIKWNLVIFTLVIAAASYVVISAPGNHFRQEMYPESGNLFFSITHTLKFLIPQLLSWTFLTPLLPVSLLLIPIYIKISKEENLPEVLKVNPLYPIAVTVLLLLATTFVPFWSMGKEPYNRNLNIVYFVFIIGWFFNLLSCIIYASGKYDFTIKKIPRFLYIFAFILIAIFLVRKNNVRVAYADLLRGTAYKYDSELNERYDFISQSKADSIEVAPIKSIPRTLFVCDIFEDPNALLNQLYAHYFDKKAVYLKKSESGQ